jgi:hypothetical protein
MRERIRRSGADLRKQRRGFPPQLAKQLHVGLNGEHDERRGKEKRDACKHTHPLSVEKSRDEKQREHEWATQNYGHFVILYIVNTKARYTS